jgi:hypothetical protein
MNPSKRKLMLSPLLAVILVLLLVGSVSFLPQNVPQSTQSPQPSTNPNSTVTPAPTAQAMSASTSDGNLLSVLFAVAAIIVGVLATFLFFSERNLKKEIGA